MHGGLLAVSSLTTTPLDPGLVHISRPQGVQKTLRQVLAVTRSVHVRTGGDLQRPDPDNALGRGVRRQGQNPSVLPQNRQDGRASTIRAVLQDDGVLVTAAFAMDDDIAPVQRVHSPHSLIALFSAPPSRLVGLGVGDALAQTRVLAEITKVAGHPLLQRGELPALPADLSSELDDAAIGLVLSERGFQHLPGPGARGASEQIDGHVVGGSEGRDERVGAS